MQQRHHVRYFAAMRSIGFVRLRTIAVAATVLSELFAPGGHAAEGIAPAPQAPSTTTPQLPSAQGSQHGGAPDVGGAPALREDEPSAGGFVEPDAEQEARPPFSGGCPYGGRSLELIV